MVRHSKVLCHVWVDLFGGWDLLTWISLLKIFFNAFVCLKTDMKLILAPSKSSSFWLLRWKLQLPAWRCSAGHPGCGRKSFLTTGISTSQNWHLRLWGRPACSRYSAFMLPLWQGQCSDWPIPHLVMRSWFRGLSSVSSLKIVTCSGHDSFGFLEGCWHGFGLPWRLLTWFLAFLKIVDQSVCFLRLPPCARLSTVSLWNMR